MQPWPSSTRRRHDDYGATSELLAGSPPSLSPASKSGALDSSSRRAIALLLLYRGSFRQRHLLLLLLLLLPLLTLARDTVMPRNRFSLHLSNILPPPPPCFLPSPNSRRFFNASEIFSGQHRNLSQHHFSFFPMRAPCNIERKINEAVVGN